MSSDLWAAFGSPQPHNTIDNKPNPFAQPNVHGEPPKGTHDLKREKTASAGDNSDDSEADSWSAVNDEIESAWQKTNQPEPEPSTFSSGQPATKGASDSSKLTIAEEDDFGDFEEAEKNVSEVTSQLARTDLPEPVPVKLAQDDEPDDFGDFAEPESGARTKREPSPTHHLGSIVDLKDFIDSQGEAYSQDLAHPSPNLLDLRSPTTTNPAPPVAGSVQIASQPKKVTFKEQPVLYAESDSDDEGNWADLGGSQSMNKAPTRRKPQPQEQKDTQPNPKVQSSAKMQSSANAPPPTNLPPPSVLMALIGSLMSELPERIRVTIVETWEEDEADVKKYIGLLQVSARIIAGRKLRWKRDTLLSQNMKIGMSGRQGGMKLAGVDRAELQREEREAAELVRNWRQNLGPIRIALAESGTGTSSKPLALPLIAESVPVRTIKPEDGGIKAARCCVICGLKREERVEKVDIDIWDQFGEWWTEHWGHTTCKAFWSEYESYLRRI